MKTRLLILVGIVFVILLVPSFSYGTWREQPLEELWEQSQTIFVGNITSMQTVDVEKTIRYSEETDGVEENIVENHIMRLDEYTVEISHFFKNPQNFDMITVREPTVSAGIYPSTIAGFEIGDNVLFYLKNIDGTNIYSPESQKIEIDNHLYYFQDEFKKLANEKSSDYYVAQIEFPDRCYSPTQIGTVRIIDPDMNADPNKVETFQIYIWSSRDLEKRTPTATETGTNTGIFEVSVFFRITDEAASQRIQAFEGDILYAQYYDSTIPFPFATFDEHDIVGTVTMGRVQPDSWWGDDWANISMQKNVKFVYDPCMVEFMNKIGKDDPRFALLDIDYPAPLKQFKSGLSANEIQCREGLTMLLSPKDSRPVCVTGDTAHKLIPRHWAILVSRG